jgi:cytidine deaminase
MFKLWLPIMRTASGSRTTAASGEAAYNRDSNVGQRQSFARTAAIGANGPIHLRRNPYGPAAMNQPNQIDDRPRASYPLVERAREAALAAYAPYSRFSVGCAIESIDGQVVVGSNMENACYRLGVCAELSALAAANQLFGLENIVRIAVTGGHVGGVGGLKGDAVVTSCGGCRQSILEAAQVSGNDIEILSANGDGSVVEVRTISELLPLGFGPANLTDAGV